MLLIDEADAMSVTPEGSPILLAERRTLSYGDRKIVLGSTPLDEETSHVLRSYAQSDGRVYECPCPRCGAETGEIIKENSRAYGCTSWKSKEEPGCGYVIWKRVAGRTITPEIARQLIENGRTTDVISGFRSRAGKPFRARLVLNDEGKVEFDFPARAQTKEAAVAE